MCPLSCSHSTAHTLTITCAHSHSCTEHSQIRLGLRHSGMLLAQVATKAVDPPSPWPFPTEAINFQGWSEPKFQTCCCCCGSEREDSRNSRAQKGEAKREKTAKHKYQSTTSLLLLMALLAQQHSSAHPQTITEASCPHMSQLHPSRDCSPHGASHATAKICADSSSSAFAYPLPPGNGCQPTTSHS